MDPINTIKKLINRKKKLTTKEISQIASLPEQKILELSETLTDKQKQEIYKALSVPKWIHETVAIHGSVPDLKVCLPSIKKTQDFKKIVEMVMISAGDYIPPNSNTVKTIRDYVKKYLKDNNALSKRSLKHKFKDIIRKYSNTGRDLVKYDNSDLETPSDDDKTGWSAGKDMKAIEKLQFNDQRTSQMDEHQYLYFTECRKASFLKYGKEKFLKWIGAKHSPKIFSWIAREKIISIIENANRDRQPDLSLKILDWPIEASELVFDF
jgi:hypothetical protein